MKGSKAIIKAALRNSSTRLVYWFNRIDALEAEIVGTDPYYRTVLSVHRRQSIGKALLEDESIDSICRSIV